jgi:hypothetical protein
VENVQCYSQFLKPVNRRVEKFERRSGLTSSRASAACSRLKSPNLNAYAEAWAGTIKRKCLDEFIVLGERHLRYIVRQYVDFSPRPGHSLLGHYTKNISCPSKMHSEYGPFLALVV